MTDVLSVQEYFDSLSSHGNSRIVLDNGRSNPSIANNVTHFLHTFATSSADFRIHETACPIPLHAIPQRNCAWFTHVVQFSVFLIGHTPGLQTCTLSNFVLLSRSRLYSASSVSEVQKLAAAT